METPGQDDVDVQAARSNYDAAVSAVDSRDFAEAALGLDIALCELAPVAAAEMRGAQGAGGARPPKTPLLEVVQYHLRNIVWLSKSWID
jgi:hypothetical protein